MRLNKTRIMTAGIVACLLVLLSGLNKPHFSPFSTGVKFDLLYTYVESDRHVVALDRKQDRMLIGNRDGRLTAVVDLTKKGSRVDKISSIAVNGDSIYVCGSTYYFNGNYLSSEKVLLWDARGRFVRELYRQDYDSSAFTSRRRFNDVAADDEGISLAAVDGNKVTLSHLTNGSLSDSREWDFQGKVFKAVILPGRDSIEVEMLSGPHLSYKCPIDGMEFSIGFLLNNILFWFCLIVVAAAFIFGLTRLLRNTAPHMKKTVPVALFVALVTTVFYSTNSFRQIESQYKHNIHTQVSQFSYLLTSHCRKEHILRDNIPESFSNDAQVLIRNLSDAHGIEQSIYSFVGLADKNGNVSTLVDSQDEMIPGIAIGHFNELSGSSSGQSPSEYEASFSRFIYECREFNDAGGNVAGIICVGYFKDNLIKVQTDNGLKLFLSLLGIFIVLFVSLSVFKTLRGDVARCLARDKSAVSEKIVDMSGLMMFVNSITRFLDCTAVVYVAQSMCDELDAIQQAKLIALPLAAQSAGIWTGALLYPALRSRIGEKKISLLSGLGTIFSLLLIVYSIRLSSIMVLSVGKLLLGVFLHALMSIGVENMPLMAKDDRDAHNALNSSKNASTAATVLAMLLGGYLAQYVSYSAIYLIACFTTVCSLVLMMVIFKNAGQAAVSVTDMSVNSEKRGWKDFFSKPMVCFILFVSIPKVLLFGYSDYLFPVFSVSSGISVLLLSNIKVFSKTLCYLLGDTITAYSGGRDSSKVMLGSMFAVCTCLICFFISPNIYWAILAFFIIDIALRICNTTFTMTMRSIAQGQKYDAIEAASRHKVIINAMFTVQSPAMSAFMSLGFNFACGTVGIISAVLLSCFALRKKIY